MAALRDEWHDLLALSGAAEVFQTHEWMSTWWEVFGDQDRALFIVTVRQGGRLVGLAPFLIRQVGGWGRARLRRLEFIGTGEPEEDEVCSDFLDIVATPAHRQRVSALVWRQLVAARDEWDEAMFSHVLDRSLLNEQLRPLAHGSARTTRSASQSERYFIDLSTGTFADYLARLSKKRRKRIAYTQRRLEKEGALTETRLGSISEVPAFLAEVGRLNRLRRAAQNKSSAFASPRFCRFHQLVAPRLWERGWLDMRLWWRQGRCVAALYNVVFDGTIYYYQSGFDTAAFGNLSPGLVTLMKAIRWGFASGCRRFDFQVGGKGSYKEDYGCETEPTQRMVLYNDSAAAHVMRSARDLRQAVRTLRALYTERRDATSRVVDGEGR